MGYNTTVVVMNDALGAIEDDPKFGARLASAIKNINFNPKSHFNNVAAHSERYGIYVNAAEVIETHHADITVMVAVGGNTGAVVPEPTVKAKKAKKKNKVKKTTMNKQGSNSILIASLVWIGILIMVVLLPATVVFRDKPECLEMPSNGEFKLQRRDDKWRIASTKSSYVSSSYDNRDDAVSLAQTLSEPNGGWKDVDCGGWIPEEKPQKQRVTGNYEIYYNGQCYFWFDMGMGISARRFNSCEDAICGVREYFRMIKAGDAEGLKRVLMPGMNWPRDDDYKKVKSGSIEYEDCECK